MTTEIFDSHADHSGFGQPDTVFATDNVMAGIPQQQWDQHILTVERMADGAMLASKVVAVI